MTGDRFQQRLPLLAPNWVTKQLERNQLPFSTLLNLDKLLQACSMEDVVMLYVLNTDAEYTTRVFGPGSPVGAGLTEYWSRRFPAQFQRVLELVGLYRGALQERLFYEDSPTADASPDKPVLLHLESQDLQVSAVLIILKPGQLGGATLREAQNYLVREYMRQLYVFTDYATLAGDALFARYFSNVTLDNVSEPA